MELRLRAIRGATTVDVDERDHIIAAVQELTQAVLDQNDVTPDDIVSIIYTSTPDLRSEFPAVGARLMGLVNTPLMCAQEIGVDGSKARCIRMLVHAYMDRNKKVVPIYLREAVSLRPDLHPQGTEGSEDSHD